MAKTVCGIYLGSQTIDGVKLRPVKKGWAIVEGSTVAISSREDADALGADLKTLSKLLHLKSSDPVTLCLPKQQAIVRRVTLPSADRAELEQMSRFETERHIPFNAERHCTTYHLIRSKGVEGSDVLLGAIDGPVVERALAALTTNHLNPRGITISSACLVNTLLHTRREWLGEKTVMVLSVGLDSLDMVFVKEGSLLYARSSALDLRGVLEAWMGSREGAQSQGPADLPRLAMAGRMIDCLDLEDHELTLGGDADPRIEGTRRIREWIDRIGRELQRTQDFARREIKCPPIDALVLTGEGAVLRNLNQLLAQSLGIEVVLHNPVGELPGAQKKKFPFDGLEHTIAFGSILGEATRESIRFDLTPDSHYRNLKRRSIARRLSVSGVLMLASAVLGYFSFAKYTEQNERKLLDYQTVNRKLAPRVAELRELQTKTQIIRSFMEDEHAGLKVLKSISDYPGIPGDVFLEEIQFKKGDLVMIKGISKSIETTSSFIQYLNGTGHFDYVQRPGDEPVDLLSWTVYRFDLICMLDVPREDK